MIPLSLLCNVQAKEIWPTCVDLGCAVEMCGLLPPPQGADATGAAGTGSVGSEPQAGDDSGGANKDPELRDGGAERVVIDKYLRLREAVARMGLERAWEMTPLLRVSEVSMRLGCFWTRVSMRKVLPSAIVVMLTVNV